MESLLKQLYNGEICPVDEVTPVLREYMEKENAFLNRERLLASKINKELIPELNELVPKLYDLMSEEFAEAFAKGFSMGLRIMAEASCTN